MKGVEAALAARAGDPGLDAARERARLARGALAWQLEASGKERAWRAGRHLRELDAQLFDARTGFRAATEAMATIPARNDDLASRIRSLQPRVTGMEQRVVALRQREGAYIEAIAIRELESRKAALAEYSLQARYALATLYDRGKTPPAATSTAP
jgi:chromosome segregation ATPase